MMVRMTHMHKTSFRYAGEIAREGGRVTYAEIDGIHAQMDEAEFDASYTDMRKFNGASAALDAAEFEDAAPGGPTPFRRYTQQEIDAAASPQGGYGKKELAALGITYPPKRGWQEALKAGFDPNNPPARLKEASRVDGDTELLRLVVVEIISQGQAHLIHHIPGLLDRFGVRIPAPGEE